MGPLPFSCSKSHKKKAAKRYSLYFMFLGTPSLMFLNPLLSRMDDENPNTLCGCTLEGPFTSNVSDCVAHSH